MRSDFYFDLSWQFTFFFCYSGGLVPGDIVTYINGTAVRTSQDIYDALNRAGQPVEMIIFRGLEKFKIVVYPEDPDE